MSSDSRRISFSNKMRFHSDKCKVLSASSKISETPSLTTLSSLSSISYTPRGILLDYVDQEKDLGVIVTSNLN